MLDLVSKPYKVRMLVDRKCQTSSYYPTHWKFRRKVFIYFCFIYIMNLYKLNGSRTNHLEVSSLATVLVCDALVVDTHSHGQ